MEPMRCIEHVKSVERTLGDEGFQELLELIHKTKFHVLTCVDLEDIQHLATVSGADAAALYLRKIQHSYPDNPISDWSLKNQLEAVYALIACKVSDPLSMFRVSFDSDRLIEDVMSLFDHYPLLE